MATGDGRGTDSAAAIATSLAVVAAFGWRVLSGEPLPGEVAAALGALFAPLVLEIRAVRRAVLRRLVGRLEGGDDV